MVNMKITIEYWTYITNTNKNKNNSINKLIQKKLIHKNKINK